MNEIVKTILQRRSIRKFLDKPVEKEKLVQLLQAAMAAPSAHNNQPWEFVVVTEPESMAKFQADTKFGEYKTPAAIVVCSSQKVMLEPSAADFWVQDCSAAIENILIAAVGLGLGTVWQGAYPKERTMQTVKKLAGLPDDVIPLAVLYVGYPDEEKEPHTRYEESRVHWQQY